MKEEKIYDVVLNKTVPIIQATNKGLHAFLARTPDDGYIEHNLILACIDELERRKKSTQKGYSCPLAFLALSRTD